MNYTPEICDKLLGVICKKSINDKEPFITEGLRTDVGIPIILNKTYGYLYLIDGYCLDFEDQEGFVKYCATNQLFPLTKRELKVVFSEKSYKQFRF